MKKVLLLILDGFGEGTAGPGNAIKNAHTPNLDKLRSEYPFSILQSNGEAVGLIEGSMGGSEVGHFTIGSGRITPQFLLAINWAIQDGSFLQNPALRKAFDQAKNQDKALHFLGMISDKGVHSDLPHLFALLEGAKKEGLTKVFIHCIADGRDVEERSVKTYLKQLQDKINELGIGKIATLVGRYYSMDRDTNWDRTQVAYDLMVRGKGEFFEDPLLAVDHFYDQDGTLTDYYLPPILLDKSGLIEEEDAVIFFNYRTDRTRQLTSAFVDPDFKAFETGLKHVIFVCMGPYSEHAPIAFETPIVTNNLGEWLSKNKVKQLRIAETEKYAHVTYFFNSQIEPPYPQEERVLVDSCKVSSYAEKPEMSAKEITDEVVKALEKSQHELIVVNYANCDLVGHSGNYEATVKAVEAIDDCLGRAYRAAMKAGYTLLLTGDHGNADDMLYPDGSQKPSHSMNPVILLIADPKKTISSVADGGLADIAPTILKILELPQPEEMTGRALI